MAPLKSTRQEKFAMLVAQGGTLTAAYEKAGYKPKRGNASMLRAKKAIGDRIDELRAVLLDRSMAKAGVTIDSITQELVEDRRFARSMGQSAPALGATRTKAQLYGLLKEDGTGAQPLTVNNVTINRIVRVIIDPASGPLTIEGSKSE